MPPMEGQEFFGYTSGPSQWGQGNFQYRNAFDLSGIPGMQGQQGFALGMLLQTLLPQILGQNYVAAPMMPSGQNLQMHYQVMDFYRQRQQAMSLGTQQDQDYYFRLIRGMSNMAGVQFGNAQQEAAHRMARDFATMDPIMSQMMPQLWDQLHGMRGSSSVMAMGMFQGGRMGYDPITGRMGYSAESAAALQQATARLYEGSTADVMERMHGLRMGQTGLAYDEMMQRGLGPRQMDREEAVRALRGQGRQVDRMAPAELDAAVRGFQADRTASQLRDYSGAIKAVQEIFGDMGHPDAPMSQIFNALQALTQGGVGRFSPAELERSVRQTYTVAKMTRIGIDAMSGLMGSAAQAAQQQGLDPNFGVEAATAGALFSHAYGASGALAAGGWRRLSKEQTAQLATQLGVQAAASDQATQLGAVAMIGERIGFRGAGATEANALASAVREGRDTFTFIDPRTRQSVTRSVFMSPADYTRIMQAGGVDQGVIDELRHSPQAVQETISRYNIGGLVRANQGRLDIDPVLNRLYQGASFGVLQSAGMNQSDASMLSRDLGMAATRALRGMAQTDRADPRRRDEAFVRSIRQQLGNRVQGLSDAQIREMSVMGWGRAEQYIHMPGSGLGGFESVLGMLDLTDPETIRRAQLTQREIAGMTQMQSAVAGLGQAGFMSRITEAVANAQPGQTMEDFVSQALGGVRKGDITKRVTSRIQQLENIGSRMQGAARAGNNAEVASLRHQAEALVRDINQDFEHAPDAPHTRPPGGAPARPGAAPPTTPRADARGPQDGSDAHPQGRGRMEIAGTLRIEWPNTGSFSGHGSDPRSGIV